MRVLALLAVGSVLLAGCSGASNPDSVDARPSESTAVPTDTDETSPASTTTPDTADAADDVDDTPIEWSTCDGGLDIPGLAPLECATIDVPLDYDDPAGSAIPIALARQEAGDPSARIGSIVFNPGGPGGSGIEFLDTARFLIPAEVADRFDLVGFDPRGVGDSASVHCELTRDDGVVIIADNDRAAWDDALASSLDELDTCTSDPQGIAPFVGTNNAARDLDRIRDALGDEQLTYVGFSYGTRLGATYAELFPDRVRALVLDGGVAPTDDSTAIGEQQAAGFDLAFGNFADACDADPDCLVADVGPVRDVLEQVRADIAAAGSFPTGDPARALTPGELDLGTIAALYSQQTWVYLSFALEEAATSGDGSIFQALADLGRQPDGTYTNQVEAGSFVNCADDPERPSEDEVWDNADRIADNSQYFDQALRASFGCLGLPEPIDPLILGPAEEAAPILVIGTTGDPATPFDWSQQLADSLTSGVLYSVDGEGHTAYTSIACVTSVVNAYLIDLEVPEPGDGCTDDSDDDPFPPAGESEAELIVGFVDCLRENGADVDPIGIADVLGDPTGAQILGGLDLADPDLLGALLPCQQFLTG
jgi:pimeloyl-ACP methyl ester carboxylesterase